jgi:predicted PurR-regulated permease PerM
MATDPTDPTAPAGDPPAGDAASATPSDGTPVAVEPGGSGGRAGAFVTSPIATGRAIFGDGGPIRRFLSRWALPIFVVVILYLARQVLLPFVFAGLIAYILAPIVRAMSERKDGSRRMPRGLAIIICYLVFIAGVVGFLFLLVPRLGKDMQRIGAEAPGLVKQVDQKWIPEFAGWLERRYPNLATPKAEQEAAPIVPDVPVPPGTAFTITPLPDGRLAVQLSGGGIDIKPLPGGVMHVEAREVEPEPATLTDKLRAYVSSGLKVLQSKTNDLVKWGQTFVTNLIKGVFTFFLILMIAAFMLIDMERVHAFLRSLFPRDVRADYDHIIAGIDRGLSGVIRGQLLICLVNGVLTFIGMLIFGVKYSFILAVVAAALSLIPIFGSILSTIPIVLAALVSGESGLDVVRGVIMVAWILGIHFIEANFLNPKIIGTAAKIHPVLVIFSLILGQASYGLVGALLAVPILSTIQVLFLFFYKKQWKEPGAPRRAGTESATARP